MLAILQRGGVGEVEALREATHMHHRLYVRLYNITPKLHYQSHVTDFIEFWKASLSCVGPERHHKFS